MGNGTSSGVSPSESPANSSSLLAGQKTSFVTFHYPISVKLDEKNYLVWRQQVLAAIYCHELKKFIEESSERPQRYANVEDELAGKVSSEFISWNRQDQLLLSWLLLSMSESMLTRVVGCERSYSVWERISQFFVSQNRAKIRQFKTELCNTRKGDRSMNEYLQRIKAIVDSLILIGNEVTQAEHIEAIFDGLSEDYDPFVTSINTGLDPYTVFDFESLLLAHEVRMEKNNKVKISAEKLTINLANTKPKEKGSGNTNKTTQANNNQNGFRGNQYNNRGGRGYNRSRGRGQRNGGRYVAC